MKLDGAKQAYKHKLVRVVSYSPQLIEIAWRIVAKMKTELQLHSSLPAIAAVVPMMFTWDGKVVQQCSNDIMRRSWLVFLGAAKEHYQKSGDLRQHKFSANA